MQNIFKIIVFFLILVFVTWIVLEKEYLKFGAFFEKNNLEIVKEDKPEQKQNLGIVYENMVQDKNLIINQESPINKQYESAVLLNCKPIFLAIDNILIKFFQRQNFSEDILLLQNKDIPQNLHEQLDVIMDLYNYKEHNIIQNKIISKVIRIEKISEDSVRKKNFIAAMKLLQEYFYSKTFLANCKS